MITKYLHINNWNPKILAEAPQQSSCWGKNKLKQFIFMNKLGIYLSAGELILMIHIQLEVKIQIQYSYKIGVV